MLVNRLVSWEDAAARRESWNRLAQGIPFRQWEWLGTWWQHYGAASDWFVLTVQDAEGQWTGIAPWCRQRLPAFGQVVFFLGSGEACTDYGSLLCAPADRERVVATLAEWLIDASDRGSEDGWDMIQMEGVAADDPTITALLQKLTLHGCTVHHEPLQNTWEIPLPSTWEGYGRQLSKPNRRHVRVLQERLLATGKVTSQVAESSDEMLRDWRDFVALHQRRRQSLGEPGCFASTRFAGFARQLTEEFFRTGQLELLSIRDGMEPVAVQFGLLGDGATYAYQLGINPDRLADSPGWLAHTESIKHAIRRGHSRFDFLRGNEPHKQRMGGHPRALTTVRVIPPRLRPRMLHTAWLTGTTLKGWIKTGLQATGAM